MPKAIRIHSHGGPEVLQWEDIEVGDPGEGEVRLTLKAAGLNFIDCGRFCAMEKSLYRT